MSNHFSARLFVGLAIWLAASTHQKICVDVANTPAGMLIYHGAAMLFDFATLVVSAHALQGRLSDDMQTLCLVSMVVNFCGWIAYLAYAPPVTYNYAIGVLGYVQYIRLLLGDSYDANRLGNYLVRRRDISRPQLRSKEAD